MIFETVETSLRIMLGGIGLVFILALIAQVKPIRIPKGLRLPPGPRGKPLVGSVADLPTHRQWETFTRWGQEHGDLVYIKAFGQRMICINSMEVAHDLFETRSSIYSNRFSMPFLNDLMGLDRLYFMFMNYGERWRRQRKMFYQHFQPTAVSAYHLTQIKHTRTLLRNIHESPDKFVEHLKHSAGAIIMESVYGISLCPTGDPYIEAAEKAVTVVAEAGNPGTFLVDVLPILKYVPEWMPGAGFQKKARLWRALLANYSVMPFVAVQKGLAAGTARPSVTASLLEDLSTRTDAPADEEEVIRNTAGTAYGAGVDSTAAVLNIFLLAMVLYPEVQLRAQIELDSILGMDRLPVFEDRQNLPYINALYKEVLRWHPAAPLGIAHQLMQDDVYGDYFIPKNTVVIGNSWAILHDENIYGPRPWEFRPERFLRPGAKDPTAAFGYGRRICPGRYMAENSIWIAICSILQVFEISRARDNKGNEIPVQASFTSGLTSRPVPFRCTIKPRSATTASLLLERSHE